MAESLATVTLETPRGTRPDAPRVQRAKSGLDHGKGLEHLRGPHSVLVVDCLPHHFADRAHWSALHRYQISNGVGVWVKTIPMAGPGISRISCFGSASGHAGTLISAILFPGGVRMATSIMRAAEAMTLFAVICAAIFPGIHVGRAWMAWFLAPRIPDSYGNLAKLSFAVALGTSSRSPPTSPSRCSSGSPVWCPEFGDPRDRGQIPVGKYPLRLLCPRWRGSNRNWRHYELAYLIRPAFSTPLVLSVTRRVLRLRHLDHSGWHNHHLPALLRGGAIFGGFAMWLTIMLPASLLYPQLKDLITREHVDRMAKIICSPARSSATPT